MDIRRILSDLISRGSEFVIYTDIMYSRGINGVDFDEFCTHEKIGSSDLKTDVSRTFDLKDDHIVITENYAPPKIPWNRSAEKRPYSRKKYIGYERVTYIKRAGLVMIGNTIFLVYCEYQNGDKVLQTPHATFEGTRERMEQIKEHWKGQGMTVSEGIRGNLDVRKPVGESRPEVQTLVKYWDLTVQGWRSFNVFNLVAVEG